MRFLARWLACCLVISQPVGALPLSATLQPTALTVQDAIEMVRVQRIASAHGRLGAISADGRRLAFVTWQGSLSQNANIYRLQVVDLDGGFARTVAVQQFAGDPENANASPFEQISFAGSDRIVFLGRRAGLTRQGFVADIMTGVVSQVTQEPTDVRGFVADFRGVPRLVSAVALPDEAREGTTVPDRGGGFLWDPQLFSYNEHERALTVPRTWQPGRYYHLGAGREDEVVYRTRERAEADVGRRFAASREEPIDWLADDVITRYGSLTGDPAGRQALIYPFIPARTANDNHGRIDGQAELRPGYGLIDLQAGTIAALTPYQAARTSSANGGGPPVWSPDGRFAALFLQVPGPTTDWSARPRWLELNTQAGTLRDIGLPAGWLVVGWSATSDRLVVSQDNRFAVVRRTAEGWSAPEVIGEFPRLNWRYGFVTNGTLLVGLSEDFATPPELVAIDLRTKRIRRLTNLNPGLGERQFGEVRDYRWRAPGGEDHSGLLILPPYFRPGARYPLVILLDDATLRRIRRPFLLDGFLQNSGHAARLIAAEGMVVLYAREPANLIGSNECERMRGLVDSAVAGLEDEGLIDRNRVGLSGWSRAAYHANCIVIRSREPIAAATFIDGGAREYLPSIRPFSDDELARIRPPLLFEPHGPAMLAAMAPMADRLSAMGSPSEILYFPDAPHDLARPRDRLRSLTVHVDWWQFWLMDLEDSAPAKSEQYRRWRQMRVDWTARRRGGEPSALQSTMRSSRSTQELRCHFH